MKYGIMAAVLAATLAAAGLPAQATAPAAGGSTASAADGTTVRRDTLTVLPGDPRLDPDRLVPRRVTWRVTIESPDGSSTVQGLWTDTWVRAREAGRDVMIFRTLFADTAGAILVEDGVVESLTLHQNGDHLARRLEEETWEPSEASWKGSPAGTSARRS